MGTTLPGTGVVLIVQACLVSFISAEPQFKVTPLETAMLLSWTGDPTSAITSFDVKINDISYKTGTGPELQQDGEIEVGVSLLPGETYTIKMFDTSDPAKPVVIFEESVTLKPKPPVLNTIEESSVTTDSITLMWTPSSGKRDKYIVTYLDISDPAANEEIKNVDHMTNVLLLTGLAPGHNYSITVQAQSGQALSSEVSIFENTRPLPPNITEITARDSRRLLLKWAPAADSLQSSFIVAYSPTAGGNSVTVSGCTSSPCEIMVGDSFQAGAAFLIKVVAVQGQRKSTEASMSANTKPMEPGPLQLKTRTTTSINIQWDEPQSSYTHFRVQVEPDEGTVSSPAKGSGSWTYLRTGLQSGQQYTFSVFTVSGSAESGPQSLIEYTKPPIPIRPTRMTDGTTINSLGLVWSAPSMAGDFDKYRVLLKEKDTSTEPPNSGSPRDVTKNSERMTTFTNLKPGVAYTVTIMTVIGDVTSDPVNVHFRTKPLPPQNLVIEKQSDALTARWDPPSTSGQGNMYTGFQARLLNVQGTDKTIAMGSTREATFSNLQQGVEYTVEVWTVSDDQQSDSLSQTVNTKPVPVQNLRKVSQTMTSLTVEWDAPISGIYDSYVLTLSLNDVAVQSETLTMDTSSFEFTGLQMATQYKATITSKSGNEVSTESTLILATQPRSPLSLNTAPSFPTETMLAVQWEAPAGAEEFRYKLVKSGESKPLSEGTVQGSTTKFTWDSLSPGSTYIVEIYTIKFGVNSDPATIEIVMVPMPPSLLTEVYRGQTSLQVSWTPPTSSHYNEFVVVTSVTGDRQVSRVVIPRTTTMHEIRDLDPGVQYTVQVFTSSNDVISSSAAEEVLSTLPTSVASIEVKETTSSSISVSWQEPANAAFDTYQLRIDPNDGGLKVPVTIARTAAAKYTFGGLQAGRQYTIDIRTSTSVGSVSEAATRTVTTLPMAVVDLLAKPQGVASLTVQWKASESSTQDSFLVQYKPVDGGSVEEQTTPYLQDKSSYTVTLMGLLPGHTYDVTVVASINDVHSVETRTLGTTVPKPVINLEAMAVSSTTVQLSWDTSTDSQQDGYKISYRGVITNDHRTWSQEIDTTSNPYVVQDLFPGERYEFRVKATSRNETGDIATASQYALPLPPSNLHLDELQTQTYSVKLVWEHDPSTGYVAEWKVRYTTQGQSNWKEVWVTQATTLEKVLTGLVPGQKYDVEVFGATAERVLSKNAAFILAIAKPVIASVLREEEAETTNDTVVFTFTESQQGVFDYYLFSITPDDAYRTFNRPASENKVVFDSRQAGNVYTIHAKTVSDHGDASQSVETSDEKTLQVVTRPNLPVVQTNQESSQIELYLSQNADQPGAQVDEYLVMCDRCNDKELRLPATDLKATHTYTGLVPFSKYTFSVKSVRKNKESAAVTKEAETKEAAPGPVNDFRAFTPNKPFEVTLVWDMPTAKNGHLTYYQISYSGQKEQDGDKDTGIRRIEVTETRAVIDNLKAGYTYIFTIQAATIELGTKTTTTITMPIGKPFLARKESAPSLISDNTTALTSKTVTLKFVDPFNDQNGDVVGYTVIVTGDDTDQSINNKPVLESWASVQSKSAGTPYQAIEKCPHFFSNPERCASGNGGARLRRDVDNTVIFTVGSGDCSVSGSDFCNGPLNSNTRYFFKLRAYTENNLWEDSQFSEPITTRESTGSQTTLIIVLVVLGLMIVVAILLILVVLVRRGIICDDTKSMEAAHMAPLRRSLRLSSRKKRQGETSRPVAVADFAAHVKKMSADSDFRFSEEYEDLKQVGREQSTNAADLPVNRNKNRFTNILPYDHSRVKLLPTDDEEGSDYINANYMPGYNSKREFIVTQGPLPSTRDDMWRMVWEQHARAIVMLTRCVEKGREKCDHYWPVDSEPMFYGDLQVTILHETKCPDWIVTEFKVSKGETSRNVKHFHYIGWPDFGVPEKPQTLIQFVRLVRGKLSPEGGPIIVHCSAGVGRSGTFIALDRLLQKIHDSDDVDIFGIVYEMRKHRVWMVQTEQQYICIHNCLLCVLEGREDEVINYGGEENEAFDDDEGITMDPN